MEEEGEEIHSIPEPCERFCHCLQFPLGIQHKHCNINSYLFSGPWSHLSNHCTTWGSSQDIRAHYYHTLPPWKLITTLRTVDSSPSHTHNLRWKLSHTCLYLQIEANTHRRHRGRITIKTRALKRRAFSRMRRN